MKNKRERERNNNPTKKKKKKKKKKEREREKIRKRSFDVINGLFALCLTGTDVCRARDRKFLLWISDGGVSNDGCQIHVANWSVCKHGRLAAKRTPRRSEEGHVHAHTHAHTHTHTQAEGKLCRSLLTEARNDDWTATVTTVVCLLGWTRGILGRGQLFRVSEGNGCWLDAELNGSETLLNHSVQNNNIRKWWTCWCITRAVN